MGSSSPIFGMKIKNIQNHHLVNHDMNHDYTAWSFFRSHKSSLFLNGTHFTRVLITAHFTPNRRYYDLARVLTVGKQKTCYLWSVLLEVLKISSDCTKACGMMLVSLHPIIPRLEKTFWRQVSFWKIRTFPNIDHNIIHIYIYIHKDLGLS